MTLFFRPEGRCRLINTLLTWILTVIYLLIYFIHVFLRCCYMVVKRAASINLINVTRYSLRVCLKYAVILGLQGYMGCISLCNIGECEDEIHFCVSFIWQKRIYTKIKKNPLMSDTENISYLMKSVKLWSLLKKLGTNIS